MSNYGGAIVTYVPNIKAWTIQQAGQTIKLTDGQAKLILSEHIYKLRPTGMFFKVT